MRPNMQVYVLAVYVSLRRSNQQSDNPEASQTLQPQTTAKINIFKCQMAGHTTKIRCPAVNNYSCHGRVKPGPH